MSTQNINISPSNVKGKCDMKCSYAFKYSESNSTAKNNGVLIQLTYDSTSIPPVIYNSEKYVVENIVIVSPSIHTFNNNSMPGEIIITHNPQNGGNNFFYKKYMKYKKKYTLLKKSWLYKHYNNSV